MALSVVNESTFKIKETDWWSLFLSFYLFNVIAQTHRICLFFITYAEYVILSFKKVTIKRSRHLTLVFEPNFPDTFELIFSSSLSSSFVVAPHWTALFCIWYSLNGIKEFWYCITHICVTRYKRFTSLITWPNLPRELATPPYTSGFHQLARRAVLSTTWRESNKTSYFPRRVFSTQRYVGVFLRVIYVGRCCYINTPTHRATSLFSSIK